jgi:hypothetical protein
MTNERGHLTESKTRKPRDVLIMGQQFDVSGDATTSRLTIGVTEKQA